MSLKLVEDFYDLDLNEFPYDRFHTALGEYHHMVIPGKYGNWYDPIALHQFRSLDGNWMVTSDGNERFIEQNRGNNSKKILINLSILANFETYLNNLNNLNVLNTIKELKYGADETATIIKSKIFQPDLKNFFFNAKILKNISTMKTPINILSSKYSKLP